MDKDKTMRHTSAFVSTKATTKIFAVEQALAADDLNHPLALKSASPVALAIDGPDEQGYMNGQ
ncbi:hypothetical protein [Pseudodonghicola xiamenensis]|uniref:Uncharacterized protein n=1 Tax=Pseudodonghicola xiamenensis TaxID=337702 RepID=A0A8J3HBE7_9RHOB|nr:hypothetical protein [Pseudodonghicola xiamenensis]GHG99767.1 hypothetical protein GCM10010961_35880 [Pseudodonghicola xiamenensis]